MKELIVLSSENMGDASRDDYESWILYVCKHIDERCGFYVEIMTLRYGEVGQAMKASTSERKETMKEALDSIWESWCNADEKELKET